MVDNPINDSIFYGREEVLHWITQKMENCSGKNYLLGIHGIPGIGKTAILQKCRKENGFALYLNCRDKDRFQRLRAINVEASKRGFHTPRFNIIYEIAMRAMGRINPSEECDSELAKDLIEVIPYIGGSMKLLFSIAKSGRRIQQFVQKRYGKIKSWLESKLGTDYGLGLLQLAENNQNLIFKILLESFVEDLSQTKTREDKPFLILLDSFDDIQSYDYEYALDKLRIKVTEEELWQYALAKLPGSVSVFAGRTLPHIAKKLGLVRQDEEIYELSEDASNKILHANGITNATICNRIVEISFRNPFVIVTICEIWKRDELSLDEIASLASDNLIEIREKVWKLFLEKVKSLSGLITHISFLPFFNETVFHIVYPISDSATWKTLIKLSFVDYDERFYYLHDLVRTLALGELGDRKEQVGLKIRDILKLEFYESWNHILMGLYISIENILDQQTAIESIISSSLELFWQQRYREILEVLEIVKTNNPRSRSLVSAIRGSIYLQLHRASKSKELLKDAYKKQKNLINGGNSDVLLDMCYTLISLGTFQMFEDKIGKAQKYLQKAEEILLKLHKNRPHVCKSLLGEVYNLLGYEFSNQGDYTKAINAYRKALKFRREMSKTNPQIRQLKIATAKGDLGSVQRKMKKFRQAEELIIEAVDTLQIVIDSDFERYYVRLISNLIKLGNLYGEMKRFDEAYAVFNEALEVYDKYQEQDVEPNPLIRCNILDSFALTHLLDGKLDDVLKKDKEILSNLEKMINDEKDIDSAQISFMLERLLSSFKQCQNQEYAEKTLQLFRGFVKR